MSTETYTPPAGARGNARKVLRWKKEHGDAVNGMTATGWARARQLASGKPISRETVGRMAAFARHRKNSTVAPEYENEPWRDAGYVAWLGWGGDSGINWAADVVERKKSYRFAIDRWRDFFKNCGTGAGGFKPGNDCQRPGSGSKKESVKKPRKKSSKIARAIAAHVLVDSKVQQESDKKERALAKSLNGMSFKNSEPVDIVLSNEDGSVGHGIEHKYMPLSKNKKVTMNKYAQVRKVEWERKNKSTIHTVVEMPDGSIYYRRGVGSFRVDGMHKLKNVTELKSIITTADRDLPEKAKRTDAKIKQGTWKPTKDGRGYQNTKTKEIVRPKK